MTTSLDTRARIVNAFRRDLVGPTPHPEDADLAAERLNERIHPVRTATAAEL